MSSGKAPYEASHHRVFSPQEVALLLEQKPDTFQGIGLFTGIRSDGIVILDVDANLTTLRSKWGDSLDKAPCIVSTKKNAAKFVFRVPVEQRSLVKGLTLSQTRMGYEVLWGMQGVIAGAYPGSRDGTAKPGHYRLASGSFDDIPDAPEWLLAEMRARKAQDAPVAGLVKNRRGLDFSGRTQDEIAEIIHDCLEVLPHLGRGSEDQWWQIGAMVAEALPTEQGLLLWSAWSATDPAFEDDWAKGDPCAEKWMRLTERAGKPGNMGLGSLVKLADEYDPQRQRFQESSRTTLEEVESSQAQRYRFAPLDFSEVITRARELLELDNPAEMNYRLHALAVESGYRDKESLERLLVDQMQFEGESDTMSIKELLHRQFERTYLIPDLLPSPSVVLVYGAGGDGKSMAAWTLAKHVATGEPFVIRGKPVPVQQGAVLLLNGDQPLVQLQEQLEEVEIPDYAPVTIRTDWSLQRYAQFIKLMETVQPKLVVIDSLIGCSGGKAFDENKSDFATPLYWLTRNNGVLFPPTTIIIIHHANKQGGFRGTSAIRDAVDEVWALKRPSDRQQEAVGANARLIGIEKSRSGRGGSSLLLKIDEDLCFNLTDYTPEIDPTETGPSGITDRVLARLRTAYPEGRTRVELNADPIVGGRVTAIRKALQRLEKRGLISVSGKTQGKAGGRPQHVYRAILSSSRGEVVYVCPLEEDPSGSKGGAMGHRGVEEGECLIGVEVTFGTFSTKPPEVVENSESQGASNGTRNGQEVGCPIGKPLWRKGLDLNATDTEAIRARRQDLSQPSSPLERSQEELEAIRRNAFDSWK